MRRFGTRTAGSGRSNAIISPGAKPVGQRGTVNPLRHEFAQGRSHDAHRTRRSRLACHRHSRACRTARQPGAGAVDAPHPGRDDHRRRLRRASARSRIADRGEHHSRRPARGRRRAGGRAGARPQRKIHHPGAVRFPCALGRVYGRAVRQSRRDLDRRAGERTEGVARAQPGRPRPSAVLPSRGPAAALQRRFGGRHPPDGADLARERTRFRVVRSIQRQEFPRLCDRSRRSPQSRIRHLRAYRQRARLGPRRNGHHRAYLGLRRSRHVAGAAAFVQGRQIPDLGDLPDRLEQARCNDRGRGSPGRVPQSHAALRMGRHEQARFAAGTGGLSGPQQSGPLLYPTQCRRRHSRPATADQELFFALREYAVDQPPVGGRSQGIRDRLPERARVHQTVRRGGRQDPRRHGYDRGRDPGPRHASRDGDTGRGRPHADAGDQSGDLMAGRIAAGQERKPRHGENRLDPTRQLCRSRRGERGSA